MIPMTVALVVVQEMSARMGAVTGKGLSDLIREEYGFRITFFMMLGLVVTNFGNVVAEFAGIASSLELFHVSRYISVPAAGILVWFVVVKEVTKASKRSSWRRRSFTSLTLSPGFWPDPAGKRRLLLPSGHPIGRPFTIRRIST